MAERTEPAYARLVAELRALIESGQLRHGDRLPRVDELVTRYQVPTGTAARAIAELKAAGLVVARPGVGTTVRGFLAVPRPLLAYDPPGDETNVEIGEAAPPDWVRKALSLRGAARAAVRSSRYLLDGERPIALATVYWPATIARGTQLMHTDQGAGGAHARLAELGHRPKRVEGTLRARMPTDTETTRLALPPGTPVVEVTRTASDATGRSVEVDRSVLDGAVFLLGLTGQV